MLDDPKEIEIIAQARQKNVRDPNRSRQHFENIFADFLADVDFQGTSAIDLGPGQYDFSLLAARRGATELAAIDNDPAVVALGRHRGYRVKEASLQDLDPAWFDRPFDGVFCKFSINCFWFLGDKSRLEQHIGNISALVKPGGWSWIAPWNGLPKTASDLPEQEVRDFLEVQRQSFQRYGFTHRDLTKEQASRYGITGSVENNRIFTRNL
jgi:SAM-dependent methyltransferase